MKKRKTCFMVMSCMLALLLTACSSNNTVGDTTPSPTRTQNGTNGSTTNNGTTGKQTARL